MTYHLRHWDAGDWLTIAATLIFCGAMLLLAAAIAGCL